MMNESGFIVITDEEGNDLECEVLDSVVYEGGNYVVLLPVEEESFEPEAVILRENAKGELEGFDDGDVLDAVFRLFLEKNGLDK